MNTWLFLCLFVVVNSAIWAYFDASRLREEHHSGVGPSGIPPQTWAALIFLIWPAAFPYYLQKRAVVEELERRSGPPPRFVTEGLNSFAVGFGLLGFAIFGGFLAIGELKWSIVGLIVVAAGIFGGRKTHVTREQEKVELGSLAFEQVGFSAPNMEDQEDGPAPDPEELAKYFSSMRQITPASGPGSSPQGSPPQGPIPTQQPSSIQQPAPPQQQQAPPRPTSAGATPGEPAPGVVYTPTFGAPQAAPTTTSPEPPPLPTSQQLAPTPHGAPYSPPPPGAPYTPPAHGAPYTPPAPPAYSPQPPNPATPQPSGHGVPPVSAAGSAAPGPQHPPSRQPPTPRAPAAAPSPITATAPPPPAKMLNRPAPPPPAAQARPNPAPPSRGPRPSPQPPPRPINPYGYAAKSGSSSSSKLVPIVIGLILVAALAAAAWFFLPSLNTEPTAENAPTEVASTEPKPKAVPRRVPPRGQVREVDAPQRRQETTTERQQPSGGDKEEPQLANQLEVDDWSLTYDELMRPLAIMLEEIDFDGIRQERCNTLQRHFRQAQDGLEACPDEDVEALLVSAFIVLHNVNKACKGEDENAWAASLLETKKLTHKAQVMLDERYRYAGIAELELESAIGVERSAESISGRYLLGNEHSDIGHSDSFGDGDSSGDGDGGVEDRLFRGLTGDGDGP